MLLAAEDNCGVVSHVDTKAVKTILVTENHCSLHSGGWDLTKSLSTLEGREGKGREGGGAESVAQCSL